MAVVDFTCLCSTYSLCSFSPIVSIFLIVHTTVSSSISSDLMQADMHFHQGMGFQSLQLRSLTI